MYKQAFDLDLYAYRVIFHCFSEAIEKLVYLKSRNIYNEKDIEVELLMETIRD